FFSFYLSLRTLTGIDASIIGQLWRLRRDKS
ncbi:MAG: hypothetical protein JWM33_3501, partial [Caulobacteraceae bacterium]|nr:hypothetical protein [Caulobacteraceae bacterium]